MVTTAQRILVDELVRDIHEEAKKTKKLSRYLDKLEKEQRKISTYLTSFHG